LRPGEDWGFPLKEVRAVVSKRGVDDGNQKGGGFLQPAQESQSHYNMKSANVKRFLKIFFEIDISESIRENKGGFF
jgi:hypothetical protein